MEEDHVPVLQVMQAADDVAPTVLDHVGAEQFAQVVAPAMDQVPGAHAIH